MDVESIHCGTLHWMEEKLKASSMSSPAFGDAVITARSLLTFCLKPPSNDFALYSQQVERWHPWLPVYTLSTLSHLSHCHLFFLFRAIASPPDCLPPTLTDLSPARYTSIIYAHARRCGCLMSVDNEDEVQSLPISHCRDGSLKPLPHKAWHAWQAVHRLLQWDVICCSNVRRPRSRWFLYGWEMGVCGNEASEIIPCN